MVKTEELIAFLAQVPLFQGLKNRHLKQIADHFAPRTFQPGQAIVTQGQTGFGMFMITSGQADALLELADGTKTVVNTFGPTDFFGEVALLDGGPRTASVIASEETECLLLGRTEFISLMHNDSELATDIAIALAKRLRRALSSV